MLKQRFKYKKMYIVYCVQQKNTNSKGNKSLKFLAKATLDYYMYIILCLFAHL